MNAMPGVQLSRSIGTGTRFKNPTCMLNTDWGSDCACEPGWIGADCNTQECPKKEGKTCNGRGECQAVSDHVESMGDPHLSLASKRSNHRFVSRCRTTRANARAATKGSRAAHWCVKRVNWKALTKKKSAMAPAVALMANASVTKATQALHAKRKRCVIWDTLTAVIA